MTDRRPPQRIFKAPGLGVDVPIERLVPWIFGFDRDDSTTTVRFLKGRCAPQAPVSCGLNCLLNVLMFITGYSRHLEHFTADDFRVAGACFFAPLLLFLDKITYIPPELAPAAVVPAESATRPFEIAGGGSSDEEMDVDCCDSSSENPAADSPMPIPMPPSRSEVISASSQDRGASSAVVQPLSSQGQGDSEPVVPRPCVDIRALSSALDKLIDERGPASVIGEDDDDLVAVLQHCQQRDCGSELDVYDSVYSGLHNMHFPLEIRDFKAQDDLEAQVSQASNRLAAGVTRATDIEEREVRRGCDFFKDTDIAPPDPLIDVAITTLPFSRLCGKGDQFLTNTMIDPAMQQIFLRHCQSLHRDISDRIAVLPIFAKKG